MPAPAIQAAPLPVRRPEVLDFLATRRSVAAKTMTAPGPSRAGLEEILAAGARVPDHGMLVPFRFVVLEGPARDRVAAAARAAALEAGLGEENAGKAERSAGLGPVVVAVICIPVASPKIPVWEQELSAGAACAALVNAGLAAGWGANWLTGPVARTPAFLHTAFAAPEGAFVAGFVHFGTPTVAPAERERPDLAAITDWPEA